MKAWGAVAALVLVAGCSSGTSDAATEPAPGPAYTSVDALAQAIIESGAGLECTGWQPAGPDGGFALAAASGYCGAGDSGSFITLYDGTDAVAQAVPVLEGANPSTPLFVGRNWILVARDAQKLEGKMPGRVDKNGAEFNVQ